MAGIAGAFHHWNGNRAIDRDVRHRAAGNRAEQRRRNHRDLGRAAAIFSHDDQSDVGDELIAADGVERLAEKNERNDHAGGNRKRHAEQAVGVEIEIACDARPCRALGGEQAGKEIGEFGVENTGDADPHKGPPCHSSGGFQNQKNGEAAQDPALRR